MSEPLLQLENVAVHFDTAQGRLRAVDGVDLELGHGRTLGIVGESGSGKSVLSRMIMGLWPSNARLGKESRILLEGRDLLTLPEKELRKIRGPEVSMIFQDPMTSLNPVMTVGRQIAEGPIRHLGKSRAEARDLAVELLTAVGIPQPEQRIRSYPHQLSGGMRQRVAIAMALACQPKLLIADEPTTALDVTVQAEILDLLARQTRDRHMALILITHDLGVVAGRTDEVAVMYAGKVVERSSTRELFADMRMPYTEALLQSIPRLEDPPHKRLSTVGGRPPNLVAPPPGCSFAPRCPYADRSCEAAEPRLEPVSNDPTHQFACFKPLERGAAA
ncbi:MAG: ABC transporter ATP-binding protein [Minwuia sp.]|uniref:ABC transporter ATP-binding protein n=1 Tax=Minwuia sp. TaxID=2493630 RepID=UPI003A838D86